MDPCIEIAQQHGQTVATGRVMREKSRQLIRNGFQDT
jgi:hypothetical protein